MPTRRKTRQSASRYLLSWNARDHRYAGDAFTYASFPLSIQRSLSLFGSLVAQMFQDICVQARTHETPEMPAPSRVTSPRTFITPPISSLHRYWTRRDSKRQKTHCLLSYRPS